MLPKPWQSGQAPNGLLNENSRGCGTSYGMLHCAAFEPLAEAVDGRRRRPRRRPARSRTPRRRPRRRRSRSSRSAARGGRLRSSGDRRSPAAIGRSLSVAGSTSSSDTVWPSTYSRPKPLRRSAATVSATGSTSPGRSGCGGGPSSSAPSGDAGSSSSTSGTGARAGRRDDRHVEADQDPRALAQLAEPPGHDLGGFANDLASAVAADRSGRPARRAGADSRGSRSWCPTVERGIADAVLLADGDRRADALDRVDVRLLHPLEELPGVGRQRLDVAALPLGIDGVEGERRLAGAADPGHHDQRTGRQRQIDVLQVVGAGAANDDLAPRLRSGRHGAYCVACLGFLNCSW